MSMGIWWIPAGKPIVAPRRQKGLLSASCRKKKSTRTPNGIPVAHDWRGHISNRDFHRTADGFAKPVAGLTVFSGKFWRQGAKPSISFPPCPILNSGSDFVSLMYRVVQAPRSHGIAYRIQFITEVL